MPYWRRRYCFYLICIVYPASAFTLSLHAACLTIVVSELSLVPSLSTVNTAGLPLHFSATYSSAPFSNALLPLLQLCFLQQSQSRATLENALGRETPQVQHLLGSFQKENTPGEAHEEPHRGQALPVQPLSGLLPTEAGPDVPHIGTQTGEKPYKCSVCPAAFAQQPTLVMQLRTHTGEKPFQYDICNKWFVSQSCRARHKRIHMD